MLIADTCICTAAKSYDMTGPVFIYTIPSDEQCIQHQEGIMMHIELCRCVI
jgi:hypothetical protein